MNITWELSMRVLQMFLCHGLGLYVLTVPKYRPRTTLLGYALMVLLSLAFSFFFAIYFDLKTFGIAYLLAMGLSILTYFKLTDAALSKSIFIFSAYANFYTLTWTLSLLLSRLYFTESMTATAATQAAIYAFVFLPFGRKINKAVQEMQVQRNRNWWLLSTVSGLFSIMLTFQSAVFGNIALLVASELATYLLFLLVASCMYVMMLLSIRYIDVAARQQIELLRLQIYERQLTEMKHAEETMRRTRHDIRHHNLLLAEMLKRGEMNAALNYVTN